MALQLELSSDECGNIMAKMMDLVMIASGVLNPASGDQGHLSHRDAN